MILSVTQFTAIENGALRGGLRDYSSNNLGYRIVYGHEKGRSGGAAFSVCRPCCAWQIFLRKISSSNQACLGITDYSMIFDTSLTACLGITDYSMIFDTTPAPTVRPPSRMAKRRPSSIAIGAISSTVKPTLSPGITISVPSASVTVPVTSVVRK